MLHHMIDDLKASSAVALRLSALAIGCGLALFITTGFLCAAIFVMVLQRYGLPEACFAGAAVFLILTLITALAYVLYVRELRHEAPAEPEKSAIASALSDPAMIAVAVQIARTVGMKRLVPLLAITGVALGLFAGRRGGAAGHAD